MRRTAPPGALLAYATFSWGDACIKALGGQLSIFEIGFFSTLFAGFFLLFAKPRQERWRHFLRMKRPWLVQARAVSGLGAGVLGIVAFTTIPFAEAYALIFLSPLFITLLSVLVLKEPVSAWRWATVLAGFAGVVLVVRPGFREVGLGHLAAVGVAMMIGASVILLRLISGQEKRTSILGVMVCYALMFNGVAALATGAGVPALAGAQAVGAGRRLRRRRTGVPVLATTLAPASRIGPTQYTQIAWATAIGALAFGEFPDALAIVGLAVVAAAGLLMLVNEPGRLRARLRSLLRWF